MEATKVFLEPGSDVCAEHRSLECCWSGGMHCSSNQRLEYAKVFEHDADEEKREPGTQQPAQT